MAVDSDRPRSLGPIRLSHALAFLAVVVMAPAQQQESRARLVAQMAGENQASIAELSQVFTLGSRPWEKTLELPLVVEQRDAQRKLERTFYFALEANDLGGEAPRLPCSTREVGFARAVERFMRQERPAPWPVFVFSAASTQKQSLDVVSLATTRRIIVRDGTGAPQPATAILLDRAYWGTNDAAGMAGDDRLTDLVARHEFYHAKRAWLRAEETVAHADVVELRLHDAGIFAPGRLKLESLVRQGIMAWEEVEAVDRSLVGAVLPTYRRQRFLEYRERNKDLQNRVIKVFAGFFTGAMDAKARKELEQWLTDLLRKDLHPGPR